MDAKKFHRIRNSSSTNQVNAVRLAQRQHRSIMFTKKEKINPIQIYKISIAQNTKLIGTKLLSNFINLIWKKKYNQFIYEIFITFCSISGTFKTLRLTSLFLQPKTEKKKKTLELNHKRSSCKKNGNERIGSWHFADCLIKDFDEIHDGSANRWRLIKIWTNCRMEKCRDLVSEDC